MPYQLRSDLLAVDIAAPGEVYSGPRFDWGGFITQITYHNNVTFCSQESFTPGEGTGGIGFCNAFGSPIGFEDAAPGQEFQMLGIGFLTRLDHQRFNFWKPYPVQPYSFIVDATPSTIAISCQTPSGHAYAAALQKVFAVENATLTISYTLTNTGSRPIVTHEYNHNFIAVNGRPIDSDYILTLPWPFQAKPIRGDYAIDASGLRLIRAGRADFALALSGFEAAKDCYWQLLCPPEKAGIRASGNFVPSMFNLWGNQFSFCPEVFLDLSLAPGQSQSWQRRYEFFAI